MKRNITLVFLLFTLLGGSVLRAQYNQQPEFLKANSVWVFGQHAMLDFNSGTPPVADSAALDIMVPINGAASVSDPVTGELLFYSDGASCWNAAHALMPNGSFLMGMSMFDPYSSGSQGVCIVPFIDSPGKYYLISMNSFISAPMNPSGGLFYSVVDMSLDGGLGAIDGSRKSIVLDQDTTLSGMMVAIPGDNCDIWLLVHDYINPVFKAYRITAEGIAPTPVVSTVGAQLNKQILPDPIVGSYLLGSMSVSPDRQMISTTSAFPFCLLGAVVDSVAGVLLTHFDPATGIVSDALQVEKNLNSFGAAFSPDNTKLYLVNFDELTGGSQLLQYDISTYDSLTIANSKTLIASDTGSQQGTLRLFGDTIYVALSKVDEAQNDFQQSQVISTINLPDLSGPACDFQMSSFSLHPGTSRALALPSEVVYPLDDTLFATVLDTAMCTSWTAPFALQPGIIDAAYTYQWSNGSGDPVLHVTHSGNYQVFYTDGCHFRIDSFLISGTGLDPVILQNGMTLSTEEAYVTYQWIFNGNIIPGATNSALIANDIGDYQVIVTNNEGCVDTSAIHEVNDVGIKDPAGIASRISVYPNPAHDVVYISAPINVDLHISDVSGKLIKKVADAKKVSISGLADGTYLFHILDKDHNLLRVEKIIRISKH